MKRLWATFVVAVLAVGVYFVGAINGWPWFVLVPLVLVMTVCQFSLVTGWGQRP